MSVKEKPIRKGILHRFSPREKRWAEKFYVLYATSTRNAARLDWYDNKSTFTKDPTVRKTLFMEAVSRVEQLPASSDKDGGGRYRMSIHKHSNSESPTLLSSDKENEIAEWIKAINGLLEEARTMSLRSRTMITTDRQSSDTIYQPNLGSSVTFRVEIDDTTAANVMNLFGEYQLVLSPQHITLIDGKVDEPAASWSYHHVRRYGFSGDTFTLEAGHKAGPASGLFIFKNCQGGSIRQAMEEKMRALQAAAKVPKSADSLEYDYIDFGKVPKSGSVSSSGSSSTNTDTSPTSAQPPTTTKTPTPVSAVAPAPKPKPGAKKVDSVSSTGSGDASSATYAKPMPMPRNRKSSDGSGSSINGVPSSPPKQPHSPAATTKPSTTPTATTTKTPTPPGTLKMSDIINQLAVANKTKQTMPDDDDDAEGYTTIDLLKPSSGRTLPTNKVPTSAGSKLSDACGSQNLYGPILLQKMAGDEECTYAEIK